MCCGPAHDFRSSDAKRLATTHSIPRSGLEPDIWAFSCSGVTTRRVTGADRGDRTHLTRVALSIFTLMYPQFVFREVGPGHHSRPLMGR